MILKQTQSTWQNRPDHDKLSCLRIRQFSNRFTSDIRRARLYKVQLIFVAYGSVTD